MVSLLSFYKDGFGIEYPTKVKMPLNKETINPFSLSLSCYLLFSLTVYSILYFIKDLTNRNGISKSENESRPKVKLATVVEGNPNVPLSIATTLRCKGGHYFFPWIVPLNL